MAKLLCEKDGICLYELENDLLRLRLCSFGAAVYSLELKEADGTYLPLTLCCDSISDFLSNGQYFGAVCGRTINRIRRGQFTLGGRQYQLTCNDGRNSAHGGSVGFSQRNWKGEILEDGSVLFTLHSPDGDEGYPGNLTAQVRYVLQPDTVRLEFGASSDQDTIVNLGSHVYWRIGGPEHNIAKEMLKIYGSEFLELDNELIPTGQVLTVKGTPYDFTQAAAIGDRIDDFSHPMMKNSRGYDVSFVRQEREPGPAAELYDPDSGVCLTVISSYPDIHIYTGNFLNGVKGRGGVLYYERDAVCLEASYFPDAINHPCFSRIVLRAGEQLKEFTEYRICRK